MKRHIYVVLVLLCLHPLRSFGREMESVSLIQLIATPEKYHGQRVRVEGYLHYKFEDMGLYLTKAGGDYLIGKNAVWIAFSEDLKIQPLDPKKKLTKKDLSHFDCKYVLIEGTFDKDRRGHMGLFSAAIVEVTRILESRRWHDGRKRLGK